MQPQQLVDLVQCAFFESNTQRSQAEQVLLKHKDECPDEFMVYCASGDVDDEYQGLSVQHLSLILLVLIHMNQSKTSYRILLHNKNEYRKASVMAFGALAEVQKKEIEILIKSALTCLIDLHYKVKKATA